MIPTADGDLVAAARSGDKIAFGELIERHESACLHLATSLVNEGEIAKDLVQEAVLHAYLSLDHLRDDGKFGNWLLGIVVNLCRDYRRKRAKSRLANSAGDVALCGTGVEGLPPDPLAFTEEREVRDLVAQALDALPSRCGAAARLFYVEGRNLREIADALRVSIGAVKGRLHRARAHLRDRLSPLQGELVMERARRAKEKAMIPLTIADVVLDEEKRSCVVVLHDQAGQRLLPIWIGETEGRAIAMGLRGHFPPRPMPHDLMAKLLKATGAKLERVRIESLKEMTFYAVLELRTGRTRREVDARPSDALALAVRLGAPIVATEEVVEKAGVAIPTEHRNKPPLGAGIDAIVTGHKAKAMRTKETELREVVAFVFEGNLSPGGAET